MHAEQLELFAIDPIEALAANLGVTIHPSSGCEGGRVPCWPGENPAEMIGMLDEELTAWLTRELDWRVR